LQPPSYADGWLESQQAKFLWTYTLQIFLQCLSIYIP